MARIEGLAVARIKGDVNAALRPICGQAECQDASDGIRANNVVDISTIHV